MEVKLLLGVLILTMMLSTLCTKGVKTDFVRGIRYSYNGFTLKDIITYNSYKRVMDNNKLPENSMLYVEFKEISNFTQENGKVFPGCDLQVKDQVGNLVLKQKDLYADYSDVVDVSNFVNPYVNVYLSHPIISPYSPK